MLTHTSQQTPKPRAADVTQIRVLVVDDHPAVRAGARLLIDDQPDMRVVAEASSVDEALGRLESPFDVAIVDYHLAMAAMGSHSPQISNDFGPRPACSSTPRSPTAPWLCQQ